MVNQQNSAKATSRAGRRLIWLALGLVYLSATGAGCPHIVQQYTQPIPRALPTNPSLVQVIDVVNANSSRVQSVSSSRATLSTLGYPSLSANIAFQRPRSFRLVGNKFGPQLDMGSNDELLWMWVKNAQPPALFFCRHQDFAVSSARQMIPIEPEWLIEAFGVVTLDQASIVEGPSPVGKGRIQIRNQARGAGQGTRILIIDESRGIVLENHVYDPQNNILASAILSKHVHDPASDTTLPRHVVIHWPTAKLEMTIDMPDLQVNQLVDQGQLFVKPTIPGYNEIDLAQPNQLMAPTPDGQTRAQPSARY